MLPETTLLLPNWLVVGLAFRNDWRAGHSVWRLFGPLLLSLIPRVLLGARRFRRLGGTVDSGRSAGAGFDPVA